ncbi:4-hydroxythreonine-4-phosphate dehydrogenase PdxA [Limnohabitans sp.]|jgi:4-hydroxythreonine-4-phosphate dehydrogenase|uniref:4-hydroxythreonine-4-phosphate dehydrogenase PdxA n=1 Tax=Limnohabitans sp. TaxID=1907725 RepID=UPI0037BF6402
MTLPTLALFTGDPAGIGPELVEKMLHNLSWKTHARVILIGQKRSIEVPPEVVWHDWSGANAPAFERGVANAQNGRYMIEALAAGVDLVTSGQADAFCFAPLNKSALRQGGMNQEDELRWFAEHMHFSGVCGELNVLKNLWTARVTSHVPLNEVSSLLSPDKVADAIRMISQALQASGVASPRIAVCGLNPHNGDNGNYGDEEGRIITPGVQQAAAMGFAADGPFPADTTFVRAIRSPGGYDGVVTMYHDQGQIAMKLMGFEQGVTVHGGLPCPITTPAHGTAYDISGQGVANPQAMTNAFELAARMAASRRSIPSTPKETLP